MIAPEIESDLYAYVGGVCRRMRSPLLAMGGTTDHVHMLVSLGKTTTLAGLMLDVKRDTSKLMKAKLPTRTVFAWQDGYFAFSIGQSGEEQLQRYIARHKTHHARVDFKDEVRAFLKKYKVEFDERYVWS